MRRVVLVLILGALAVGWLRSQGVPAAGTGEDAISVHRNLGKAFYENPTTHQQAVDEFQKALEMAPDSTRERINYGLALLRAGKTKEGVAELQKAQQQDPLIPHTWFNLGIAFKKESEYELAVPQFEKMVELVPDEPISQYNLGFLYRVTGKPDLALRHFEEAARLDPNLAGPHFQLYNAYRQAGRAEDAERELKIFQEIKKQQAGAVIPEDLDWSYYAEVYETIEPHSARDAGPLSTDLKFADTKLASGFDAKTSGLAVLDFNGDGRPDLLAWSAGGVQVYRDGSTLVENAGLVGLKGVLSIAPGDFNNDGLPDLCVVTESGASLYVNQRGRFQRSPAQLPAGQYAKAVWLDYDHDYDLDLVLLGEKSALVRNNGSAGFSDLTKDFPFVAGRATDGTVMDLVPYENSMDLVVAYADRSGVIYRDKLGGKYETQPLAALRQGATAVAARDLDNDGWTDLAASYSDAVALLRNREGKLEELAALRTAGGAIGFADFENRSFADLVVGGAVFRNRGLGQFLAAKPVAGESSVVALAEADFSQDGRTDLAAVFTDGSLHLLKNENPTRNAWLQVGLTGVKNLKLAPGARVEVKAGTSYQKQTYSGVPLTFGLLSYSQADTVRITWPNGLIQNEMKQPAGKLLTYKEAQRLSGSCPMIFTWNGDRFEFITDVLGVAPLGASAGDWQYFPVDHDEYVQIPGRSLALVDGRYEIRITEELREVSYLDEVRLVAVDHPSDVEIFTNDKFKAPPFPEFRLFGVRRRAYPKAAQDHQGRDVLGQLLRRDATYPDRFQRDYSGVAELHHLDLDFGDSFGDAAPSNRAILVLHGWLDWADGSTYRAISQESAAGLILPYLQVKDASGRWQTVIEDMGIPAGKPKTIVVDLTGKFLSDSREVRIVTNLSLYWDEIFLSEAADAPPAVLSEMEPESAALRFRGFSTPAIHPERKQPERFDYGQWMPVSMGNPTPGLYTRYGDVRPLLRSVDDQLVLMGSGDELRLLFSARNLPPLQAGWQRDFLLLVDGWAKDQDANTAYAQSVEPLPFHGMSAYPYPSSEHFPNDELHRLYREQYNTRPALRLLSPLAEAARETRASR